MISNPEQENECQLVITTITTVCMWGHENCKIDSHFKYKWSEKQTELVKERESNSDELDAKEPKSIDLLNKTAKSKANFDNVKRQWEVTNNSKDTASMQSKSPIHSTANTSTVNKNKNKFEVGGMGVTKTLELLKGQLNHANKKDGNSEKEQRNDELDRMKRLRQAGVTREYLRS